MGLESERDVSLAVKRNAERFPADFMFQLTAQEFENLKSQIVTSSWGGFEARVMPMAGQDAVRDRAAVQRKTEMRAAIVDCEAARAVADH